MISKLELTKKERELLLSIQLYGMTGPALRYSGLSDEDKAMLERIKEKYKQAGWD